MKTNIGNRVPQPLWAALLILWSFTVAIAARPPQAIQVNISEAVTLPVTNLSKAAIADAAIADVVVLSETEISVIGKKIGTTTLTLAHTGGIPTKSYRVEVGGNGAIVNAIRSLITDRSVTVTEVGDAIVLDGQVQDEIQLNRTVQIAEAFKVKLINLLEVKKPRQVAIRTRVAEVSSTAARKVGFRWFGTAGEVQYAMDMKNLDDITDQIRHGFLQPKTTTAVTPTSFSQTPSLDVILQLLVDNNYARLLAEPTLITKSGSEASFLVGEERPIVQVLANSVTVDYKKIGVHMKIKPTADSQNRIATVIHAEVSQVIGVTATDQYSLPIIGTKTADSTLHVNDGQTIVIGGLLENNLSRDYLRKLPWLAEIPVIGHLFRHRERESQQREVLFFMTPSIVKDVDASTAGAARTPLMQQWNGATLGEKVLEVPPKDEPPPLKLFKEKATTAEPAPATPKKAPTTNFGPARSGGE